MAAEPRALGGAVWTVGGYAAMQVLRFGYNVLLAKMVAPKVFGVMALVNLVIQGLQMFSDLGLRQCVVQHARGDDPDFLNTAWTLQVVRGAALWAGSSLLAYPLAQFYDEPALLWLVPLAGAAAFVTGFTSTATLTCSRHVRRGPLVRREVGTYAVTVAVVLTTLWWIDRNWPVETRLTAMYFVITFGAVFSALVEVALSFTLPAVAPPRFRWDAAARRQLLTFGGWVFLSTGCTFLAAQADRLIVGRLSLETLGVYHIAAVIAAVPAALVTALGFQLVFPMLSAAARRGDPPGPVYRKSQRVLLVVAGLLATGAACVGPTFIGLVYDQRYRDAAVFVQLLSLAAWFTMLVVPSELALLTVGRTRCLAIGQMVRLLSLAAFLPAGYVLAGVPGLIVGVAAGELVRYVVVARYAAQSGFNEVAADVGLSLFAGGVAAAYLLVEPALLAGAGLPIRFVAGAMLLTLVWFGAYTVVVGDGRWAGRVAAAPLRNTTRKKKGARR